jgi:hypothetical protein
MSAHTPIFTTPPTILFVGQDADLADVCGAAMPAVSLLRVGHPAGAVQRMLVTRPLVVIVDDAVNADQRQDIADCARDIAAGFVDAAGMTKEQLTEAITTAALGAEERRAREPMPSAPPPSVGGKDEDE